MDFKPNVKLLIQDLLDINHFLQPSQQTVQWLFH